jgi:Fe-S oxidoreductase
MLMKKPIDTTENCRYCLMCRHVCPVGHVTNMETLTPHGWGLTVASVKRGLLEWDEETVGVLYKCADCGNCRAHCVNDQPLPEAIAATRKEIVQQKLAPAVVHEIQQTLQEWGNPYKRQTPKPVEGQSDVALFVGDEAEHVWPTALEASLKLLQAVGIKVVLIGIGRNNGYLASSLGLRQAAQDLASANLEDLKAIGASRLLVLSAGDFFTFSQLYEERLGISWPKDVELLEVTAFLADQLKVGTLRLRSAGDKAPSAYMDPTNAVRIPTRHAAPRQLVAAVLPKAGRELFWRQERAHPCGNSALQFTQPELADQLTQARLNDALQVGVDQIITEDPGCLSHLSRHASSVGVRVQGLYELLADCLA